MSGFVSYPNPLLTRNAEARPVDADLIAIGERLREAAVVANAYGLAANHIGEVAPVVVVNLAADGEARDDFLLYNPEVIAVSSDTESGIEGSVSMPGIQVEIARPVWVDLRWQDQNGAWQEQRFERFAARVLLHEIEQMRGQFFLHRLSRLKRDSAIKKFARSQRATMG